jgi:hypothetical protein
MINFSFVKIKSGSFDPDLDIFLVNTRSGDKTASPSGAKRCIDSSNSNPFLASYDHAGTNGCCNSDASTSKTTPKPQGATMLQDSNICSSQSQYIL